MVNRSCNNKQRYLTAIKIDRSPFDGVIQGMKFTGGIGRRKYTQQMKGGFKLFFLLYRISQATKYC